MEIVVCAVCLIVEEIIKETEWKYERVEKMCLLRNAGAKSVVVFRLCWTC